MLVNIDGLKELSLLNLIYSEIILNYHNLEEVGVLRLGKKKNSGAGFYISTSSIIWVDSSLLLIIVCLDINKVKELSSLNLIYTTTHPWCGGKYKCLWGVSGKNQGSSHQEKASNTYTLRLG